MGRPVILRCRGGDRDTEVTDGYSRPGNRPTHASITQSRNKHRTSESKWPSALPALSESRKDPDRDQTRLTNSVTIAYIQKPPIHPHIARTRKPVESRCPGETTRRWLGRPSPLLLSRKSRDFWGTRWASQSQIAKIAAISVR